MRTYSAGALASAQPLSPGSPPGPALSHGPDLVTGKTPGGETLYPTGQLPLLVLTLGLLVVKIFWACDRHQLCRPQTPRYVMSLNGLLEVLAGPSSDPWWRWMCVGGKSHGTQQLFKESISFLISPSWPCQPPICGGAGSQTAL